MLFSSFLTKVTSPSFSLIKKWNYNIWILNYVILILNHVIFIFINSTPPCLNILPTIWPESWMTHEIQPVKNFKFQHMILASPSFSLIKKWNYNIWILNYVILILNHVILIFINSTLPCLNILPAIWPELWMTREIQPVKNFKFQHMLLAWPISQVGTRKLV